MRRQFLAVLGVFGIAGGMVAVQSASAETAVDCVATAATGGPWSNVYNQSVTVRDLLGGSGVFNGARVTVTLPAGHSYAGGWNPTLAPSSDRTVVLDIDGSLPAGGTLTNSGFNVTVASDADLSLRPTFSCEALPATPVPTTTVNPPTTSTPEPTTTVPAAACGVSAVTGGPWGNTYNQSLTIRSLFGGAGSSINGVAVTVRFPAGRLPLARFA